MIELHRPDGDIVPLSAYNDYCIVHELDGCDKMSFCIPTNHEQYPLLYEEARITTEDNEWLIKKIDDDKIDCELNFDFLKDTMYRNYKSQSQPLLAFLQNHLPSGWSIEGASNSSINRTIEFEFCTDFDVIYECMKVFGVYFVWHIKDKRIEVYMHDNMQSTGEYLTTELKLRKLSYKGDTTTFATRLYSYGKDGLTMEEAVVDGQPYGLEYVDNNEYAEKVVCAYWKDERYTNAQSLYEATVEKVKTLSRPVRSYECDVIDLAKQNENYDFLQFKMHYKVTLIDVERKIKVDHQVVRYKEYPEESIRNVVTLSCAPQTIQSSISSAITDSITHNNDKIRTEYNDQMMIATAMLTSAFKGYPYTDNHSFYLLDNERLELAQVVWRFNTGGFGLSTTGFNGPYTTALTLDGTFLTSMIDSIKIRGSLIEAGTITAEQISQMYKDELITETFTTVEGVVQAEFQRLSKFLTGDKDLEGTESGALNLLQKSLTSIQATIDGLSAKFTTTITGGVNYVRNSAGLNGTANGWVYTGTVTTDMDTDTKNSTVSNSCCQSSSNGKSP